jgi:hypothetical protein
VATLTPPEKTVASLSEAGIDKNLARRARLVASLPPDEFEDRVEFVRAEIFEARHPKFAALYADPPWSFLVYSGKGKARSAENHYDTMGLEAIGSTFAPFMDLLAPDAALFLWGVWPELPEDAEILTGDGTGGSPDGPHPERDGLCATVHADRHGVDARHARPRHPAHRPRRLHAEHNRRASKRLGQDQGSSKTPKVNT